MTGSDSAAFIVFCLAFVLLWHMVAQAGIWPAYVFPSPAGVLSALAHGIGDGSIPNGTVASLKRMAAGFGIAVVIGATLGVAISHSRILERSLGTLMLGVQTLPSICWLPLAILWFGLSDKAILFVVVAGAVGSITMAISAGISNTPPIYINAARTMGAKGWRLFWEVTFPAALPTIVSGVRQGWSFAWRSLMAGELLYVSAGLGQLLQVGRELNDINQVVAVMLVIMCIGFLVERLVFLSVEEDIRRKWGLAKGRA
jgi:NitT/TauT family transport system permease protein